MKLLMISGDRSILNGKQGAFYSMLEEFSKHWERIDVICPSISDYSSHSIWYQLQEKPLFGNVHFHPATKGLLHQPSFIVEKGTELIAEHHHDIVTVHDYPPFYNGIGARRLHKKTGVPYVVEIHHIVGYPYIASFSDLIGRVLSRLYLRWNVRHAAQVRVVNHVVENLLVRWGIPSDALAVVPSFYLDSDVCKPNDVIEKHYDIVFCARLVKNKGLMEVIDAVGALSRVTLLIVGDGPLKQKAEKRVSALGMLERVTFTGWLPTQRDVMDAIQSGRVFIQNSKSEGGPRVALEAMACGMPILTTRVGVMPDVVRDGVNGMFISGKRTDLMIKIDHLLHDPPLRRTLGTNARDIVRLFERHHLIATYAHFLQSFARTPPPSVPSPMPPSPVATPPPSAVPPVRSTV